MFPYSLFGAEDLRSFLVDYYRLALVNHNRLRFN